MTDEEKLIQLKRQVADLEFEIAKKSKNVIPKDTPVLASNDDEEEVQYIRFYSHQRQNGQHVCTDATNAGGTTKAFDNVEVLTCPISKEDLRSAFNSGFSDCGRKRVKILTKLIEGN